jgi:hypothetical protein
LLLPPPSPLPSPIATKLGVMVNSKSSSAEWGSSVDLEQEDDRSRGDGWQSERHGQQSTIYNSAQCCELCMQCTRGGGC